MEPTIPSEFTDIDVVPFFGPPEYSEDPYPGPEPPFLPMPPPSKGWRSFIGILLALTASALFSLILLVVKLLENYHPFMISFWRTQGMFAIIPFVIYYSLGEKKPIFETVWPTTAPGNRENILLLLVSQLLYLSGASSGILQYFSVRYINIADSSTVSCSTPIFVTLASYVLLREKSGVVTLVCGVIALCGVAVITRPPVFTGEVEFDTNVLIGSIMAVGSMLFNVSYFITQRSLLDMHYSVIMLFIGVCGSVVTSFCAVGISRFEIPQDVHDWILVGSLILLSFIPQMCCTLAFKFEEAGTVALFRTFDIIFAFVWQYAFLGIIPDRMSLIGGSIVTFGVLLAAFRKYISALPLDSRQRHYFSFILT